MSLFISFNLTYHNFAALNSFLRTHLREILSIAFKSLRNLFVPRCLFLVFCLQFVDPLNHRTNLFSYRSKSPFYTAKILDTFLKENSFGLLSNIKLFWKIITFHTKKQVAEFLNLWFVRKTILCRGLFSTVAMTNVFRLFCPWRLFILSSTKRIEKFQFFMKSIYCNNLSNINFLRSLSEIYKQFHFLLNSWTVKP